MTTRPKEWPGLLTSRCWQAICQVGGDNFQSEVGTAFQLTDEPVLGMTKRDLTHAKVNRKVDTIQQCMLK